MTQANATDGESIRETASEAASRATETSHKLRWGVALVAVAGLGLALNGATIAYRALFEPGFEAGVGSLGGTSYADLAAANHELAHYVDHLHLNVAGLLVAGGIAVAALAVFGVRRGKPWALGTAVAIPVVFLAFSLPVHGAVAFDYDTLAHLGPGALWAPAALVGGVLAALGMREVEVRTSRS